MQHHVDPRARRRPQLVREPAVDREAHADPRDRRRRQQRDDDRLVRPAVDEHDVGDLADPPRRRDELRHRDRATQRVHGAAAVERDHQHQLRVDAGAVVVHGGEERVVVAERHDLLEREVARQDPRGVDEPLLAGVEQPRDDLGRGRELRLDVGAGAALDHPVHREERADQDHRDEDQEGNDEPGLEAP
ncbi:MAG: hypothetical protein FJZ38_21715 [Candidatus Rokubacteria bacterium]|nr:hypothetical protein [Candidatus Rokubacteria bacterium]